MGPKLLTVLLATGGLLVSAGPSSAQAVRSPAGQTAAQAERFCEEERRFAEPWIRWAAESRMACMQQTKMESERFNCLESVRVQLDMLQREHAEVYLSQMKSLRSDHPVMISIMQRLQANRESARIALETGTDPAQVALLRQQSCLAR